MRERTSIAVLALALHAGVAAPACAAEAWPQRPVRFVVGFAAGGPTDILARTMASALGERLGQQVVVENRPGAGGNVATEAVVKSPPNGYTVLVVATANAINTSLYPSLPYDFFRDMEPVAGLARISYVMTITPGIPARDVPEFVRYAKSHPGAVSFGSGGTGGSNHLTGELFKAMTGIDIVHVPYKGNAAAYADLLAGRLQLLFADRMSALPHLQSGGVRALAVTSTTRSPALPDVPTVAETLPGFEASAWYGFAVPRGTPRDVVDRLSSEINAAHADPKLRARFAELDAAPIVMSPAQFTSFMRAEAERWGKLVRSSGAKPE